MITDRLAALLILLLAAGVEAATFADLFKTIIESGRNDVNNNGIVYPATHSGVRMQPRISEDVPFPCNTRNGRSPTVPDNVHRLRPGDIDVIGALGDSLIAASGAMEEFAVGAFIESRGISWCAGGQGDWRRFFTIPNLLKVFNPNLIGYSTGTGEFISPHANLNIAFPVAATEDALHQARILVQKIKSDPAINVRQQWKFITIFFGANDICSGQCYSPENFSPIRHALHLRRTLDFLKLALPRTLVNLVPAIDVTVSLRVRQTPACRILHPLYCACLHRGRRPDLALSRMSSLYQQAAEALIHSGRYDNSPDFTVVLQPFMKLFNSQQGDPSRSFPVDSTWITHDCFHFSQKGHALGANLHWNNMFEPVGNKTDQGVPQVFDKILCPTNRAPYIFTNVNSRNYRMTGWQDGIVPR